MKKRSVVVTKTEYASELHPWIVSESEVEAELLAWADADPRIWDVVLGTKSATFGRSSYVYPAYARGSNVGAVLSRLAYFRRELANPHPLFKWRAERALQCKAKGFTSGRLRQFALWPLTKDLGKVMIGDKVAEQKEYPRHVIDIDYLPSELEDALDRFQKWAENERAGGHKETTRITLSKGSKEKLVRRVREWDGAIA